MEKQSQTNLMSRVHPLELDLVMQMQQKHHYYQYCTNTVHTYKSSSTYSTDAMPYIRSGSPGRRYDILT